MKIQSPWMGRIKGSAGNMTGCKVYDKNVMRAKAFEVSNPNTAAQQVQRGYFAELINLVAGFSPEQLRTLFPNKPKAMSRRNALSRQLAEYYKMSGTEKVVDFAAIDTLGNAPTIDFGEVTTEITNSEIEIDITEAAAKYPQYERNFVIFAVVNVTKKQIALQTTGSTLISEIIIIPKPTDWGIDDQVHAIPLITDSIDDIEDFGNFNIMFRPMKKSN